MTPPSWKEQACGSAIQFWSYRKLPSNHCSLFSPHHPPLITLSSPLSPSWTASVLQSSRLWLSWCLSNFCISLKPLAAAIGEYSNSPRCLARSNSTIHWLLTSLCWDFLPLRILPNPRLVGKVKWDKHMGIYDTQSVDSLSHGSLWIWAHKGLFCYCWDTPAIIYLGWVDVSLVTHM